MVRKFAILLFITLLCVSVKADEMKCTFILNDRALDVKIDVPQNNFDKTSFTVSDWAGETNYAENIYRVAAKDKSGKQFAVEKTGARTWTVANAKKPFELSYTVVAQKDSFMGDNVRSHFHPTIFKNYAFLWGMTFLLFPEAKELLAAPVKLQVITNEYANYYSNFTGKAASFDDLSEYFLAAGDYRVVEKNIGGRRVKFLLEGKDWKFTDEEFTDAVSRIMDAQVKYMGFSPSNDDLLVTLTEGTPNSKGGTVVKNVISVYPNPQTGINDFETLKLISHEHFHFFNGNYWREASGKKEGYYKWMSEGFTEYYAGLTLYRENLITEKEFVAWLNKLLLDYQTNPYAQTATAAVLAEKYWESQNYNRLPYIKGALIGFLSDLRVRQNNPGKQIDDLMRYLIGKTDRKKGYTDALLLGGFDAVMQKNNQQFFDEYILGARVLPVTEVLKVSGIATAENPTDVFDFGFKTESGKLERGAKIKELTTPSAIEAGLKIDDEIRGYSYQGGKPQEQASFTVQRGAENLTFKYYPKKSLNILQIDENARIPR